jgi:hypothetical protein
MHELPGIESVLAKINGADARDTAARRDATFAALRAYVEARAGFVPPQAAPDAVAKAYHDYQTAQTTRTAAADAGAGLGPEAARYSEQGTSFQLEVLFALLSAESVAQYRATPAFQKRQAEEAAAALARAAAERVRVAKGRTTADLNVLGVQLLEPLSLPACPSALNLPPDLMGIGRGAREACRIDASASLASGFTQALKATVRPALAKRSWILVVLADSACPRWMRDGGSCALMIESADDVAAAALVPTSLDAKTIEDLLSAKYKQPAVDGDHVQCGNRKTRDVTSHTVERVWALAGLSVSFEPVSRDCTHGRILIQTSLFEPTPAPR